MRTITGEEFPRYIDQDGNEYEVLYLPELESIEQVSNEMVLFKGKERTQYQVKIEWKHVKHDITVSNIIKRLQEKYGDEVGLVENNYSEKTSETSIGYRAVGITEVSYMEDGVCHYVPLDEDTMVTKLSSTIEDFIFVLKEVGASDIPTIPSVVEQDNLTENGTPTPR